MIDEALKPILEELARRVGIRLEDIDFSDDNWYSKHQWTITEEQSFYSWLEQYINDHPEVKPALLEQGLKGKTNMELAIEFCMFFAWDFKFKD